MSENQASPGTADTISSTTSTSPATANRPASTSKSTVGKKLKTPKRLRGKMRVSLLRDHEHVLRIASVIFERNDEEIHEPQQLVDLAMDRFMDYLKIKRGIDIQELLSKQPTSAK